MRKRMLKRMLAGVGGLMLLALAAGCQSDSFTHQATTQFFVQDLNPEFVDVLWMVDDRSPMFYAKEKLVEEAKKFFTRLDAISSDYRMAFVSADMRYHPGELKPQGAPVILTKGLGDVTARAGYFGQIVSQILNLKTDAESKGLASALAALKGSFQPRPGVPLVVVFISDADDKSTAPEGEDVLSYYEKELLALKGGNRSLVRVYSINYEKLANGEEPDDTNRCATRYNADIDSTTPGYFQDRYFRLAERFNADLVNEEMATADLCGAFSNNIDLSGLRLKELTNRFRLDFAPRLETLDIAVYRGEARFEIRWTYDSSTNEVVFETTPPEGTTIQVTYERG